MNKRDELIKKYEADLREKCGVEPDGDLLRKVTIGLGPSIYNKDSATVSATDPSEIERLKNNFLIKKLGLSEEDALDAAIESVIETYGKSVRTKHRAVVYYLLVVHFDKAAVYG